MNFKDTVTSLSMTANVAMPADGNDAAAAASQDAPSPATDAPPDAALDSDEAVAMARAIEGSAFSLWKESLAQELARESEALTTRVAALQSAFDDTSVFIRGDVAWRKQLAAFHDTINDALATQLRGLAHTLAQNATALAHSLSESFARKDAQVKRAVAWQTQMYEDKLRRTRTSLKKEIDRFSLLEKCLRQEQAVQAQAMYDARVAALTAEHDAKEAALEALVRELRSSHSAMELGNAQLMDALRAARGDAERYKKMLSRHVQSSGSSSNSANSTSPRKSTMKSLTRLGASSTSVSGSSANIADVYIQSLKQSVTAANETIESLKKQLGVATADKDASLRKLRQTEDAAAATVDELAKVTQLLSESHTALVASKRATEHVEREREHWRERFDELAFRTESQDAELRAAKEFQDTTRAYVVSLEAQVASSAGSSRHERLNEDGGDAMALKLRYDFEKRFSEQLIVRVSHERKRVLARIETLCAKQQQQIDAEASASRRASRASAQRTSTKVPYRVVHKIVSDAFDDLSLSPWSATDLDALHGQIAALEAQLATQTQRIAQLDAVVEAQAMVLAKADLLQQEKEFLLAELTDKYKALRAAQDAARQLASDSPESTAAEAHREEVPLTVYGYPQRLELKTLRSRPVSAAPTLASATAGVRDDDHDSGALSSHDSQRSTAKHRARTSRPMTSAGPAPQRRQSRQRATPMSPRVKPFLAAAGASSSNMMTEPQQQVEHIRSVLKSELLQLSPPENQLEDGSHVGPDGVRGVRILL